MNFDIVTYNAEDVIRKTEAALVLVGGSNGLTGKFTFAELVRTAEKNGIHFKIQLSTKELEENNLA